MLVDDLTQFLWMVWVPTKSEFVNGVSTNYNSGGNSVGNQLLVATGLNYQLVVYYGISSFDLTISPGFLSSFWLFSLELFKLDFEFTRVEPFLLNVSIVVIYTGKFGY